MTRRRPMASRRLRISGFPNDDEIAGMTYDELVRLRCAYNDHMEAAAGLHYTDVWCSLQTLHHPMMLRLDALAEADPGIVDRVAAALARSRPGGRRRPGDLGRAEETLAQSAYRNASFLRATPPGRPAPDPEAHGLKGPFAVLHEAES